MMVFFSVIKSISWTKTSPGREMSLQPGWGSVREKDPLLHPLPGPVGQGCH